MNYYKIPYKESQALSLQKFKEMDYYAVENFNLPIELMMENAGLHLANLIAHSSNKKQLIRVGVGNGNNGGGGLVAARRLAAWGFQVYIDPFTEITQELPVKQLERALRFGAKLEKPSQQDVWVDAYLGFSQKLPLKEPLLNLLHEANNSPSIKISLDIPTGFLGNTELPYFRANKVLSLAAPKKILFPLLPNTEIYVADLGIPTKVYDLFHHEKLPFHISNIIQLVL